MIQTPDDLLYGTMLKYCAVELSLLRTFTINKYSFTKTKCVYGGPRHTHILYTLLHSHVCLQWNKRVYGYTLQSPRDSPKKHRKYCRDTSKVMLESANLALPHHKRAAHFTFHNFKNHKPHPHPSSTTNQLVGVLFIDLKPCLLEVVVVFRFPVKLSRQTKDHCDWFP